ncbi:hypothetical protein AB2B38_001765 [Balneola sp. MJW-20]|uniref:hypothetical protein n=1 Tax=Gracilimonas aurantiaca TaxID=3234185 RepID=UPI00346606B3
MKNKPQYFFWLLPFLVLSITITDAYGQQVRGGFYRNFNAVRNDKEDVLLIGRNRLMLDAGSDFSNGQFFLSVQALNTYSDSLTNLSANIREAYIDLYYDNFDIRIGKQIIALGRTQGAFITDVITPLDLSEFLTQPVDVIQTGIPAIKFTRYFGSNYLEAVFSPVTASNIFASPDNVWFPFRQFENTSVAFAGNTVNNTSPLPQGLIRLALRNNLKWDLDLLAMYWAPGNPAFGKDLSLVADPIIPVPTLSLDARYLRRPILAYSGNYIINDRLIIKSESAFHFQKYFDYLPTTLQSTPVSELGIQEFIALNNEFNANSDGFLLRKPWLNSMIGIDLSLSFVQISAQVINEYIFNYDSRLLQDQYFTFETLQLRKSFFRDKFTVTAFARYNNNGRDVWVNPEFSYEVNDVVNASIGAQIFTGEEYEPYYGHFSFSDYEGLSFLFAKVTAYF